MRRRLTTMLIATVAFAMLAAAPVWAQPTELQPPDDEVPVLFPPDRGMRGEADVVVLVDEGAFSHRWRELRELALASGGWVVTARTDIGEHEGRSYEYGTAELAVPHHAFDDLLLWIGELGGRVSMLIGYQPASDTSTSTVLVTLTEEAEPFFSDRESSSEGRIDRALDTAGDVLLTMASVLIVAAAVVVPVAVLAAIAYAVWRAVRRRWPIAELAAAAPTVEPLEEPATTD